MVYFRTDNRSSQYRTDGSTEVHEVTRTERQEQLHIREREVAAQLICQSRYWKYIVHTEQSLPQSAEVANLMALLRYRLKIYAHDAIREAVREHLGRSASAPLQQCMQNISSQLDMPESTIFATLCHLLWHEGICTDLKKLLIVENAFAPSALAWLAAEKER